MAPAAKRSCSPDGTMHAAKVPRSASPSDDSTERVHIFSVKDPVHGMIQLPGVLQRFIDHRYFQRLRHIRQLSMCSNVYPGATHTRFVHSIGTAFLSYSLVRSVRERQPELDISDRDVLCIAIAGLLHDVGHPCYSHMFEVYIRRVGQTKVGLDDNQRSRYKTWDHEHASIALIRLLWAELREHLIEAGLEDEDCDFVCSLVDPPKKQLNQAMESGRLGEMWTRLLPQRAPHKGWMYEIVSNWRSGLDTDRFDYFRRDAFNLGTRKEFDHGRYMSTVLAVQDATHGVWTLSPPDKDKDLLREDFFDLRRSLHRTAYQHKTVMKLEQHMIDVLELLDSAGLRVNGRDGRELCMSEAAVDFDAEAYVQLTDAFVEARLYQHQAPGTPFRAAYEEYEHRIVRRNMLRLIADFDVPPDMDFKAMGANEVIEGTLRKYQALGARLPAPSPKEFRCNIAELHQGMGRQDPLQRVLFHSSKSRSQHAFLRASEQIPPLTQKVFLFFDGGPTAHETPLMRELVDAFVKWAAEQSAAGQLRSPVRRVAVSPMRDLVKPARVLRVNTSCMLDD